MLQLTAPILAVAAKDLRSDIRTRYGMSALLLFVVTSVTLVVFAAADEVMPRPLAAAVLWIVMFTTAMTGLGRGFISEEERGTALLLRMSATPTSIYVGKLLGNVVQAVASNLVAALLFTLFLSTTVDIGNPALLVLVVSTGSLGMAAALTVISAIVAKAGSRNALLPVLSFPILVPLLLPGVNAMIFALAGLSVGEAMPDLLLMACYTGVLIVVSYLVFEVLWCD